MTIEARGAEVTSPIDLEELVEQARLLAGLDDFGDVPYVEPLDVLVYSLNHDARVQGVYATVPPRC